MWMELEGKTPGGVMAVVRVEEVVLVETIPPDHPPGVCRLTMRNGATVIASESLQNLFHKMMARPGGE